MRAALAALVAAALAGASAAVAGDGLVTRHSRAAGFSIRVPADWRYRNATYPSDHSSEYWRDPHDARNRVHVEVSGCVGCAQPASCTLEGTGCGPAPQLLVPAHASQLRRLDRWRLTYVVAGGDRPQRGLVVVLRRGGEVDGFALVRVWLPSAQASLAAAILASFRP